MQKTYKRELAVLLLAIYLGLLVASLWYPKAIEAAESLKVPMFTFLGAAFALDSIAKQMKVRV